MSHKRRPESNRLYRLFRLTGLTVGLLWLMHTAAVSPMPAAKADPRTRLPALTGKADVRLVSFDELLLGFVARHGIPGAALAVAKDGRLVYARGCGEADRETHEPVAPDALFRIASISKPVTAVAILRLVERKKLALDQPFFPLLEVGPWLAPGCGVDARMPSITVRHLLQHTGGWDRDATFDPMFRSVAIAETLGKSAPAATGDVIRYVLGRPLDFNPGERYVYSNFDYCVLGRVIEKLTGQSYEAFVRNDLLAPLGITRMRIGRTLLAERAPGEVRYYADDDELAPGVLGADLGKPVPWPYGGWYLEAMDAHGGWVASAVDLVRFASAVDSAARDPVLSRESLHEMVARPPGNPGFEADGQPRDAYYGLGWFVRPLADGKMNIWHTGSLDGTSTLLVRRHDGLTWAVLFNTRAKAGGEVPSKAIDRLLHEAADRVTEWPADDRFAEFYASPP